MGSPIKPKNKLFLAHSLLAMVALFYGANYSIASIVLKETSLPPAGFILIRVGIALVLFILTALIFVRETIESRDLLRVFLCAIFGVAFNQLTFFEGLLRTSNIHAALLMTATPLLVLVFALVFKQENWSKYKFAGILIGMSGAVLLISNAQSQGQSSSIIGDLFIFVNASSFALYLVLVRRLMAKYHPITITAYTFAFGFLLVLPFGYQQCMDTDWSAFTHKHWLSLGFVVFASTYLAYLFNNVAIRLTSSTVVSSYIYFQPLIAGFISIYFFGESLEMYHILSMVLIFWGVYLVSFYAKKKGVKAKIDQNQEVLESIPYQES